MVTATVVEKLTIGYQNLVSVGSFGRVFIQCNEIVTEDLVNYTNELMWDIMCVFVCATDGLKIPPICWKFSSICDVIRRLFYLTSILLLMQGIIEFIFTILGL